MADPELSAKDFLWVNKTVASTALSNSKGDAVRSRTINRHVQLQRSSASASQKRRSLQPINPAIIGWRWRRLGRGSESPDHDPPRRQVPIGGRNSCEGHRNQQALSTTPLFKSQLGSAIDPFNSSRVPLTPGVLLVLQNFAESWMAASVVGTPRNTEDVATSKIIRECIADEVHMYSVLAVTAGRMKHITGHRLERHDQPEIFMGKALEGLRMYLEKDKQVTQQLILDFLFMAIAEVYYKNVDGAAVHRRIMEQLVKKLGGLGKVDRYVREMCFTADLFVASVTMTAPVFQYQEDTSRLPNIVYAQIQNHLSGDGLMGTALLELDELFDKTMQGLVSDVVSLAQTAQYLWTSPTPSVISVDMGWVMERSDALTHRLLSIPGLTPAQAQYSSMKVKTQECCRLSFIIWLFYVLVGTAGAASIPGDVNKVRNIMPENTRRLRELVESVSPLDRDSNRWSRYGDLLLWILGLGALAAKIETEDGAWFARRLQQVTRKRHVYTYAALSEITSRYLSLDRLEQLSEGKLANLLMFNDDKER